MQTSAVTAYGVRILPLTTWPFNPSIRSVSAGNNSAHRAACNRKGNGHMPSATAHDEGEQSLPARPTAKPPELMYKRLTTLPTSSSGGSSSSLSPEQEEHASTTDHQHESKTNAVCRRTDNTENCPSTRYMHTESFNILEITTHT